MAHWVLGKGSILRIINKNYNLPRSFLNTYITRYDPSIKFIERVRLQKKAGLIDEFYVSYLAINELFSAIRDELRSILLFSNGIPISRWRDPRINPDINQKDYEAVLEKTMKSFNRLYIKKAILFMPEQSPEDDPNYLDIYSSILFLIKESKTQDATLLTTAILNKADYFVTFDVSLIKSAKKKIFDQYKLRLVKPDEAYAIL